jgi:hypothetical protein
MALLGAHRRAHALGRRFHPLDVIVPARLVAGQKSLDAAEMLHEGVPQLRQRPRHLGLPVAAEALVFAEQTVDAAKACGLVIAEPSAPRLQERGQVLKNSDGHRIAG